MTSLTPWQQFGLVRSQYILPTHPGHLRQRHEPVVVAVDLRPHPPPQRAVLGRAQVRQPRVDPLPVDDGGGGHGARGHVSRVTRVT